MDFLKKKISSKNIYVVPCDYLPSKFGLPAGFIVNLESSKYSGSHWIAIFIDAKGNASYFCSFGLPLKVKAIQTFLKRFAKSTEYSKQTLQTSRSELCGNYAALYLLYRFKNERLSLSRFLSQFSTNLVLNDRLIRRLFRRFDTFNN